jgi:DNA-binding SARP family transcriptional activator
MLHIQLFGTTTATNDACATTVTNFGGAKPRQILEILALADGVPVAKDRLADLLWDGEPPRSYVGTLESYVCLLRRKLGCAKGRAAAITTTSSGYVLDPEQVRVDLKEVREMLGRAAFGTPAAAVHYTFAALELTGKTLLASEPYAEYAARERNAITSELVRACVHGSRQALSTGQGQQAVAIAQRGVELDRFDEAAVEQLMRALWTCGRRAEAMRCFLDLRTAMLDELAVEPGAAMQALYLEILRDEGESQIEGDGGRGELRTLLNLLRQTLESMPGVEPTLGDSGLSYVAVKALSLV